MTNYIVVYLIIGLIWTAWLEYYTNKHFEGEELLTKWTYTERFFQTALWPLNVVIFIVAFFRGI